MGVVKILIGKILKFGFGCKITISVLYNLYQLIKKI